MKGVLWDINDASQFDDKSYLQYNAYIHRVVPLNEDHRKEIESMYRASKFDLQYGNAASTKEFQEAISIHGERFELAGKVTLSPKAIDRLAGRLLEKSKSNYSREQLTERLTALFDYIANSRDVSWEEITTIAANIFKDKAGNNPCLFVIYYNAYQMKD